MSDDAPREPSQQRHLDAEGRERPAFLVEHPDDPALARLVAAFEAGDYAAVREEAPRLAAEHPDAEVRALAAELRRRLDPDPLAKVLLLAAIGLLGFLTLWAFRHAH